MFLHSRSVPVLKCACEIRTRCLKNEFFSRPPSFVLTSSTTRMKTRTFRPAIRPFLGSFMIIKRAAAIGFAFGWFHRLSLSESYENKATALRKTRQNSYGQARADIKTLSSTRDIKTSRRTAAAGSLGFSIALRAHRVDRHQSVWKCISEQRVYCSNL